MLAGIIDYGVGNVQSVAALVSKLGAECVVSSKKEDLGLCEALILPGVGAFSAAMNKLNEAELDQWIKVQVNRGVPILGICLGMQLFARGSEESPGVPGLGLLNAEVKLIEPGSGTDNLGRFYNIPHMGWNSVSAVNNSSLFDGIPNNSDFYFANSYHVECFDSRDISGTTHYGHTFVAAIVRKNIYGVQFHPEKSFNQGKQLIKNFIEKC